MQPLGVAYMKQGGQCTKTVQPWPEGMDGWQQHLHDAGNNPVAAERAQGELVRRTRPSLRAYFRADPKRLPPRPIVAFRPYS